MSTPYISLDQFSSLSGSAVPQGGAWLGTVSADDARYSTATVGTPCGDVPHCLWMWANNRAVYETYTMKYETNISIPLSRYGNANQLSFNWSYKIRWGCSLLPGGYSLTSYSRVGSSDANSYSTGFASTDWTSLTTSNDWATTISHSGTTPVQRNSDSSSLGFVYISIDLSMPHPLNSSVSYYIKAATFEITTPTSTVAASSAGGGGDSSGSITSSLNRTSTSTSSTSSTPISFSSILSGPGEDAGSASSASVAGGSVQGTTAPSSAPTRKTNLVPAIVGGTLGAIALLSLVGFLLFLKRRTTRRNDSRSRLETKEGEYGVPTMTNGSESLLLVNRTAKDTPPSSARWDTATSAYISINDTPTPAGSDDAVVRSNSHRNNMSNSHATQDDVIDIRPNSPTRTERTEDTQQEGSETSVEAPPPYRGSMGAPTILGPSQTRPNTLLPPIPEATQTLEGFARVHRAEISEELERKLARANYLPSDDPDAISEEVWAREYAIGTAELEVLRQLYQRNNDA